MKTIYLILSACLLAFTMNSCKGDETPEAVEPETEEVTVEEVEEPEMVPTIVEDLDNATFNAHRSENPGLLLDVRTPEEFAEGHIEGAINLDFNGGVFEAALDTLKTDQTVYVYCQAGGRSGKARDMLVERHFLEVYNLKNGYGNWEE